MNMNTEKTNAFTSKGLPADFDAKCEWCVGGRDESSGHYTCPDCEGTGYKYGRQYLHYEEEELNLMCDLHEHVCLALIEVYGYAFHFIPNHAIDFCMEYFSFCIGMTYPELKKTMIEEISETFFEDKPVYVYSLKEGSIAYSIEGKKVNSEVVDVVLRYSPHQEDVPYKATSTTIRIEDTILSPVTCSYDDLVALPHDLNDDMKRLVKRYSYLQKRLNEMSLS